MKRRSLLQSSVLLPGVLTPGAALAAKAGESPAVYTRIGAQPFINLTATYTINGGALTRPEVKRAMDEAGHWPMNLDELMEHVGRRLSELLGSESAIVTSGAAAALTHATSGVITGGDPEKMQQLPDLTGLKNEVIVPHASRNVYDHAVRATGVRMVEVDSEGEARRAMNGRTALIMVLGTGEASGGVRLEQLAAAGRERGVPVLVDAAAELPHNPNPYLKRGASLVAYSGGKFLRGPQCAGLLIGRRDLVQAAWLNSSPHHSFGRSMKVGKEEIMGMLAAIEVWRDNYDLEGEYERWRGWLRTMAAALNSIDGMKTELKPPAGASPFPVLEVEWDRMKIGYNAGQVGEMLLNGKPRIMSHAEGEGYGFRIRPVAMKPGEDKIVARRLAEIFRHAPKGVEATPASPPPEPLGGRWRVDIQFVAGSARHQLDLVDKNGDLSGRYLARITQGEVRGKADGDHVKFAASLRYEGARLGYSFDGKFAGGRITGQVDLGEYGKAKFTAERVG
jgi:L-seryl-tRNA(Ser) seleniumtransferase